MAYRNEKKVPTLNEQGKLDHKFLPTNISVPVTKQYVDDGDQASKDYTDQKISEIDFPDGDITEAEVDAKDATTLASAKTYTDTKISEIDFPEGDITEAEVDAKDATTLASAKKYSDDNTTAVSSTVSNIVDNYIPEKNAETLASANAFTDTKISEIVFPDTGVPESEIDAKDDVTFAKAKEYVDALPEDFQKISVTSLDEVSSDFSGLIEVEPFEFIFREPELGGSLELVSSNSNSNVWDLYELDNDGNPVALNLRNSEERTFTFSSVSRPVGVGIYFTIPALPQLTTEELQQSGWGINSDFMNLSPGVRYEQNGNDWDAIHDTWSVNVAGYNVTNIAPGASLDLAVYQAMDGEVVSFIDGVEVHRSGGADSGYPILGIPSFTVLGLNFTNLRDVPAIPVSKYYLQVEDHEPVRLVGKDAIATWLQWDIVTKVDLRKAIENIPLPTADVTKSYVDTELAKKADTSHTHTTSQVTDLDVALAGKASTVHSHTKSDVGLGNVDNTSDANKPVSSATTTALASKANTTHTHSASDVTSGILPPERLGTGTPSTSTFLSGDGTFKVPPGATNAQIEAAVNAYLTANPPAGDPWHKTGNGMPNGSVVAPVGTTYTDLEQTNGARKWLKTSGIGNTGWVVSQGDTEWRKIPLSASDFSSAGFFAIRRINSEVYFQVSDVTPLRTGLIVLATPSTLPGFRYAGRASVPAYRDDNTTAVGALGIKTASIYLSCSATGAWTYGQISTPAVDPWPVGSLPGTKL